MKPLYDGKATRLYEPEQTGECLMESKICQPSPTESAERVTPNADRSLENKADENFEKATSQRALSNFMESHAEVLKRAKDAVHS